MDIQSKALHIFEALDDLIKVSQNIKKIFSQID